ncbi:PfkB family carbohydrate kinase [Mycobacteroides abscessus]
MPGTQITVVGGTYRERCVEPAVDRLLGSGLRAAGLLASLGDEVQFLTAVDAAAMAEFAAVCAALGIDSTPAARTDPIAFTYQTPIQPTVRRGKASADIVHAAATTVLAFGMIETSWQVRADLLVIDPQHSPVTELLSAATAARITLILNEHEARRATGCTNVAAAAAALLTNDVEAVVIKRGALGGIVAHGRTLDKFGAIPTAAVHPLGSGDAFSAGYTHAWSSGADPLAAARFGSQIAAAHSLTGTAQLPPGYLDLLAEPLPYPDPVPRIYLAGPFFSISERQLVHTVAASITHLGAEVFSPLDEIGCGGDEVANKDLDGLRGCHSVLAILDGADPGTLFEVGWATHAGIPVTGLAEYPDDHTWTMLRGTGATVCPDLSTAIYTSVWNAIAANATR